MSERRSGRTQRMIDKAAAAVNRGENVTVYVHSHHFVDEVKGRLLHNDGGNRSAKREE